jgi:hypothetical protein
MDHQVRRMRYQLAKRGLALRVSTKRERNSNPSFGPYVILEDNVVLGNNRRIGTTDGRLRKG